MQTKDRAIALPGIYSIDLVKIQKEIVAIKSGIENDFSIFLLTIIAYPLKICLNNKEMKTKVLKTYPLPKVSMR